jgi:hypothetical protein
MSSARILCQNLLSLPTGFSADPVPSDNVCATELLNDRLKASLIPIEAGSPIEAFDDMLKSPFSFALRFGWGINIGPPMQNLIAIHIRKAVSTTETTSAVAVKISWTGIFEMASTYL